MNHNRVLFLGLGICAGVIVVTLVVISLVTS
jgi:hypothetical protein